MRNADLKYKIANRDKINARQNAAHSRRMNAKHPPTRPVPAACEICGGVTLVALCNDHCHETDKFRGWLCRPCNRAIGALGDNSLMVMRAVRYLQRAEAVTHGRLVP